MTVHFGDCREVMRELATAGQRDYGVDGQIGLEISPHEFVDTMVDVFALVWELLEDDGTLWLNLGDSYGGNPGGYQRKNQGCSSQTAMALTSQLLVFPMFDIHVPLSTNLWIGAWFTVISLVRSHVIRRWFNAGLHRGIAAAPRRLAS